MKRRYLAITGAMLALLAIIVGTPRFSQATGMGSYTVFLPLAQKSYIPTGTLTICMGQEPETLYPYGGAMLAMSSVLEAVYDGPIDNRSFDYQPVILEKIPSLADGDAVTETVSIAPGDSIVDATGNVTTLQDGVLYLPSGCLSSDCAQVYSSTMGNVLMDAMVVTFKLLPSLKWSDGQPLTAADSVYSFNLAADPDTPSSKFTIERTASYLALDDLTVQWRGLPGYVDATYFLNFWTPYPAHIWGNYTAAQLLTAPISAEKPLGWGPYIIQEWVKGDRITMTYNPYYFRRDEHLPRFAQVIYRFVGQDSNVNLNSILSGECDILDQTTYMDDLMDTLVALDAGDTLRLLTTTSTVFEHLDIGIQPVSYDDGWQAGDRPDFFSDVRVRQAIAYCLDRQAVVDTVMYGRSKVIDSYTPPEHPLYNPNAPQYDFDVSTGVTLLEAAGWVDDDNDPATPRVYQGSNPNIPQGTNLEFNYWTTNSTQRQQASQILQQSLAQCGIKVNLEYWNPGDFFADGPTGPIFGRQFDLVQFAWLIGVEPPCDLWITDAVPGPPGDTWTSILTGESGLTFPYGWGGWNNTGYHNPAYDAACKQGLASLPGQSTYITAYQEAQRIFAEDLPVIPLYLRIKIAVTGTDITGMQLDPTANSEFWNIEAFDRTP